LSLFTGHHAETQASLFLEKNGLRFVCKNYHCPAGEIDLIMQDNDYCVFIEVRMRENTQRGTGAETVTAKKQKRIIKTALHYLQKHKLVDRVDCRFDVISIDNGVISWIQNAFEVSA
jgi:putative endonuclease